MMNAHHFGRAAWLVALVIAAPALAQETAPATQPQPQTQAQSAPQTQPQGQNAVPAAAPQPPRDLNPEDVVTLAQRVVKENQKFLGWLDGQHYLTAGDVPREGGKTARTLLRVNAASGESAPYLDSDKMAAAIAGLPGFDAATAQRLAREYDSMQWSRDRRGIVLDVANDLVHYDTAAGKATRLTHTPHAEEGAQLSPDGRLVAFVAEYNLWVVGIDGTPPRVLTEGGHRKLLHGRLDWIYQEELYGRGNFQGFWWSPDAQWLALLRLDESRVPDFTLVSDQPARPTVEVTSYPKAGDPNPVPALGIASARGGELRWIDLSRYGASEILIARVQWHPDASEVYLQVQDREQRWLELLAANPRNGHVRVVLRETSPTWVEADENPHWIDDGKSFLWLSSRDGSKRIHLYQRDGKQLAVLTDAGLEVDGIAGVDPQARMIYFHAGGPNPLQRHLWRVGIDGKGAAPVTQQGGTHQATLSPDCGLFVDAFNNFDYVRRVDIRRMDDQLVRTLVESDMAQLGPYQFASPEFVKVKARDGAELDAMLLRPRGAEPGKRYPAVCFAYAGPQAPQVRHRFDRRHYVFHQLLAQKGFAVLVCDNRTASGRGRASADVCFKNLGESELKDLEDAADWLAASGVADPARIGVWGWSYGGFQASYCLTHSKKWKAGVAVNPVTDWRLYDSIYTERYMSLPQTNPEGYQKSSVVEAAANLHGRFLLVHSAMDDNVHMQNSLQLAHALQTAGKTFDFMVYPRVRHGVENQKQLKHLYQTIAEHFERNL